MRKLVILVGLVFFFVTPAQSAIEDKGGAVGAGAGKTVSVDDLWDGLTGAVKSILPSGKKTAKNEKADDNKEDEDAKTDDKKKLIHAKRLKDDPKAKGKAASKTPPPYKVYQAPMLNDAFANNSFAGWGEEPTIAMESSEKAVPPKQENQNYVVPPVAALPKQFFPVFPLSAGGQAMPQLLPVASNMPLAEDHRDVQRVVIYIHDIMRNAAENVATMMTLGGSNGQRVLLLAPQFPLEADITRFAAHLPQNGRNVARWPVQAGWQEGGLSLMRARQRGVSSFTALDVMLLFLADRQRFPAMQDVVIVGHGMGGDYVQRYAAIGQAPELLEQDRVSVRFVVANPSSYLYFTNQRPLSESLVFGLPKTDDCQGGNHYPYGISGLGSYARRTGREAIRLRYPMRKVSYLIGDKIKGDHYLDRSCSAMLQGKSRLVRTQAYARHLMQSFGANAANHQFNVIRNAGYDPVSMFGSSCGLSVLFGDGVCE